MVIQYCQMIIQYSTSADVHMGGTDLNCIYCRHRQVPFHAKLLDIQSLLVGLCILPFPPLAVYLINAIQ